MPTRDGCLLATDVIRPTDPTPVPVLLVRSPYGRAGNRTSPDPVAIARSGMAVVVQDIRGRWDSAGDYRPLLQDVADGADAIAWCAGRSWCDGAVVMGGASYDGMTAWLATLAAPPALRAIAPVVSTPFTAEAVLADHGATNLGFLINWGLGHVMGGNHAGAEVEARATDLLDAWPETVARPDALSLLAELFPQYRAWLSDHSLLPGLSATSAPAQGRLPVHQITGWWDVFVEGALTAYQILAAAGARQRLVVGPWSHGQVFATSCGALDFAPEASGFDRFPGEQMAFLRACAAGSAPQTGVSVYVVGADTWLELDTWPPSATTRVWHGAPDHQLADRPAGGDRPVAVWEHDPDEPAPTVGGRTLHPGRAEPGPMDHSARRARPDVVSLRTAVLDRSVTIAGPVTADLVLTSQSSVTDVVLTLIDEHPGGRAIALVSTTTRLDTSDGQVTGRFDVGSIAARFDAGHRIALDLSSSDFPLHDVTPERGSRTICALRLNLPVLPEPTT